MKTRRYDIMIWAVVMGMAAVLGSCQSMPQQEPEADTAMSAQQSQTTDMQEMTPITTAASPAAPSGQTNAEAAETVAAEEDDMAQESSAIEDGQSDTMADEPDVALEPLPADSAGLAFMLSQKSVCTHHEAFSMVLHLVDGMDSYAGYDARKAALTDRGYIKEDWQLAATEPVSKGTMAYMLCRALDIKGGVMFHLLPNRRYAYREAVDLKLMRRGSEFEPLTGPEVVGIMGRAAREFE